MASRDTSGPDGPDARREQLLARREEQRRRRGRQRRRRLIALGAALVAVAAVVGIVALTSGGSEPKLSDPTVTHTGGTSKQRAPSGGGSAQLVRNATPQPGWEPHTGPVPILEYHVLGAAAADAPYPELYVSRPDFHQQMNWLD